MASSTGDEIFNLHLGIFILIRQDQLPFPVLEIPLIPPHSLQKLTRKKALTFIVRVLLIDIRLSVG